MAAQQWGDSSEALHLDGEGKGNPLQYSCLENALDGGDWPAYCPWGRTELDTTEAT